MRPERRHVAAIFKPASAKVVYQPLGVVGIVAPWNFPVSLALTPLATALAAGNRVMLKPSEMTPATTDLLASMLAETFDEEQVAVVTGDAKIGRAFSSLPFDHIFFTGSIPVGRAIMRAASENLVPVTLELGGKSPDHCRPRLLVAYRRATHRVWQVRQWRSDLHVPRLSPAAQGRSGGFRRGLPARGRYALSRISATIPTTPQFSTTGTSHACQGWWRTRRPKVPALSRSEPGSQGGSQSRMFPPVLLLDVTDDMAVMQEEIFGPILPVVTYRRIWTTPSPM